MLFATLESKLSLLLMGINLSEEWNRWVLIYCSCSIHPMIQTGNCQWITDGYLANFIGNTILDIQAKNCEIRFAQSGPNVPVSRFAQLRKFPRGFNLTLFAPNFERVLLLYRCRTESMLNFLMLLIFFKKTIYWNLANFFNRKTSLIRISGSVEGLINLNHVVNYFENHVIDYFG